MFDVLRLFFVLALAASVAWLAYLSWMSRNHE